MGGNIFRMEGSIQKKKKWKTLYWCWPEGYKFAMKDKKLMPNCRSMSVLSVLSLQKDILPKFNFLRYLQRIPR